MDTSDTPEPTSAKKKHFQGLDELRALAAIGVVIHHLELYKFRDGAASLYRTPFAFFAEQLGRNGVGLFFVLSGFLITYLLLSEKDAFGTIRYRAFLWRRALRIWPLYYLIVAIAFFVIPALFEVWTPLQNEPHYANLVRNLSTEVYGGLGLFLVFLPNVALFTFPAVVGASHAWSIGVEEQFYIVWPLVIRFIRNRWLPIVFLAIIVGKLALEYWILPDVLTGTPYAWLLPFLHFLRIELMALGALGAYAQFFHPERLKRLLAASSLMAGHLFLMGLMCAIPVPGGDFLLGVTFLIFILYQSNDTPLTLKAPRLAKLGKISYGIYMYHPLVMYGCFAALNSVLEFKSFVPYQVTLYVSVMGVTFLISWLSYRFLEKPFLKLKDTRFATLK